jgi:DNA-binding beta-propeller fold protein YncE
MLKLCLICIALMFVGNLYAIPILRIVPSVNPITLKANSQTLVTYTVTNNAGPDTGIIVNPTYQTSGQPSGITLINDNCTSSSLGPGGTCTFGILISGANQPSSFYIRPKVCAFNGQVCSVPVSAPVDNTLYVTVNPATQAYAYFSVIQTNPTPNVLQPINADTLQLGTSTSLNFNSNPFLGVGVAVSPDGSMVYATANASPQAINVFSSGANPQLLQTITNSGGFHQLAQVAVAPNGNTIYVTTSDSGLYVIQNNGGTYSIVNTIIGFTTYGGGSTIGSEGIAVSPDGKILYATDYFTNKFMAFDATNPSYPLIQALAHSSSNCSSLNNSSFLVVSPDGNTIYVGNRGNSVTIISNNNGTYSCTGSIPLGGTSGGLAITPDGQYLYIVSDSAVNLYIYNIASNTLTSTISLSGTPFGIAITPDGSQVFISKKNPSTNAAFMFTLVNDLPTSNTPTNVNVNGGTQFTVGNFAN